MILFNQIVFYKWGIRRAMRLPKKRVEAEYYVQGHAMARRHTPVPKLTKEIVSDIQQTKK